jgi:hypothetical protein
LGAGSGSYSEEVDVVAVYGQRKEIMNMYKSKRKTRVTSNCRKYMKRCKRKKSLVGLVRDFGHRGRLNSEHDRVGVHIAIV